MVKAGKIGGLDTLNMYAWKSGIQLCLHFIAELWSFDAK